ncbi:MAG: hypothetical protein HY268_33865 [Deltaproteobacteria bacterium]|nr:hypothetical protein [Deltaproteobacteria bacterium]
MFTAGNPQTGYEILAYLIEHPRAQDTLEGIVEWWFLEQQIKCRTVQVKEALGELGARGFVLERKGSDGHLLYRVNRRRSKDIRVLLTGRSD